MPFVPHVVVPCATHLPEGSGAPVGTSPHWPMVPASAQERHVPAQAVAQHTPCAQKPDVHSVPAEQNAPMGLVPQLAATHVLGDRQSSLVRHDEKQRAPLQPYGAHGSDAGVTHCPPPSHTAAGVYTFASQRSGAHTVPGLYRAQPPTPSQRPLVAHTAAPASRQAPCGSAAPAGAGMQWPFDEGSAQLVHPSAQAPSQQTPSTQKPLPHSAAPAQVWPRGLGPQLPARQACPPWQSASATHEVAHAPFVQL